MTKDDFIAIWERHSERFLKFEEIKEPRHPRPDLCAFLMLHDLAPCVSDENSIKNGFGMMDMVAAAEHDEIWLSVDVDALASNVTEEQIVDLQRCGVRYDDDNDSLAMFV